MGEKKNSSTWIIIEQMAGAEPTLVFDGAKARQYVSVRRREHYRNIEINEAIVSTVKASVETAERVEHKIHINEKYPALALIAEPVVGPFGIAYGAQVWLAPVDEPVPPVRGIGAFEWDPDTEITHHGPTIETDILGITDPKEQRVSPEVFRHFEAFPREADLGRYCADIKTGHAEQGETFDSPLTVRGVDDVVRQAYMTMRAVQKDDGVWALRGIVHDITDVQKPQLSDTYDRRTARVTAALVDDGEEAGIGHIDFATGIVTEWLTSPPAPLDQWLTQNAEFHPDDTPGIAEAQLKLATAAAPKAEYRARVRFPGTDWIPTRFLLAAATSGPHGHGLIRVELIAPPDSDESERGGVLLW